MVSVRVEALQHDLGRVVLDAVLVVPFARLQRALDVDLRALLQVLLGDLAEPLVEDHDAVPLGLFLALAGGLVAPAFRGGDRRLAIGRPSWVRRISGSLPRLPIRITLFTEPAMTSLLFRTPAQPALRNIPHPSAKPAPRLAEAASKSPFPQLAAACAGSMLRRVGDRQGQCSLFVLISLRRSDAITSWSFQLRATPASA